MSGRAVCFADVVAIVERLPLDEQESLVEIVRKRIVEDERRRLAASARSAKREHQRGRCRTTTPEELMKEILA